MNTDARAPFSYSRDTSGRRLARSKTQRAELRLTTGTISCVTEVDDDTQALPFSMVFCKPAIFRPTLTGPASTFYCDTLFEHPKYPLLIIENEPRLAKFQPEVRSILNQDNSVLSTLCRSASNTPLAQHSDRFAYLQQFIGKGPVGVNLTTTSVSPVVVALGTVAMHAEDNQPILIPLSQAEADAFIATAIVPVISANTPIFTAVVVESSRKRMRPTSGGRKKGAYKIARTEDRLTRKEKIRRLTTMISV